MIERLVQALRLLAAPAEDQFGRAPMVVGNVSDLALDFADALLLVTDCPQVLLAPEQQSALEQVEDVLEAMRGEGNASLWTEAALRNSTEWQTVRQLARRALLALSQPEPHPEF
jgi:hypothetical protein